MKRYPKELLSLWPKLCDIPFDAESELARSFLEAPAEKWKSLSVEKRTALGWVVSKQNYGGLDKNQVVWANHLIAAGADVYSPLSSSLSHSFFQESFYTLAWKDEDRQLLDIMFLNGFPAFRKHWLQVPFFKVVQKGNLDWIEEFLQLSTSSFSDSHTVYSALVGLPKPEVLVEVIPFLRKLGLRWDSNSFDGCLSILWREALLHPEHPAMLEIAKQCWDDNKPSEPPFGWGDSLGFALVAKGDQAAVDEVRRALEERLTVEQRPAWVPLLPSLKKLEGRYAHSGMRQQWSGIWNVVEWGTDWGIPPRQRDEDGIPWGLSIMRKAYKDRDTIVLDFPKELAWRCLEKLILTGHEPNAKPLVCRTKKKSRLYETFQNPGSLFSPRTSLLAFFKDNIGFDSWQFPQWKERFELARRQRRLWKGTEKAWQEAQHDNPVPSVRRPRF